MGGESDEARAKSHTWQAGAHFRAGYNIGLGKAAAVEPYADLHGVYVNTGSFTESGSSPFNLDVAGHGKFALSGDIGLRANASIHLGKLVLRPFLGVALEASGDADWMSFARIAGQPQSDRFAVTTAAPTWLVRGDVGMDVIASNRFDLSVAYSAERAKDFHADNFNARVSYRF